MFADPLHIPPAKAAAAVSSVSDSIGNVVCLSIRPESQHTIIIFNLMAVLQWVMVCRQSIKELPAVVPPMRCPGIVVDNSLWLSWSSHVGYLAPKVGHKIGALHRARQQLPPITTSS